MPINYGKQAYGMLDYELRERGAPILLWASRYSGVYAKKDSQDVMRSRRAAFRKRRAKRGNKLRRLRLQELDDSIFMERFLRIVGMSK